MTTIARLLLGLSKKGINPKVLENSGQSFYDNCIQVGWKQAERNISVFFDRLTGTYKGYTRSLTRSTQSGNVTEAVSLKRLANEPGFRKSEITKSTQSSRYVFNPHGEDYVDKSRQATEQLVTTSVDPKANVFTVLRQTPNGTTVSPYSSTQIFPLSH